MTKSRSGLLISGGIDSIALAAWLRPAVCLTIDYGQVPADAEIRAARAACADLKLAHEVLSIDCSAIGSGDLAGRAASVLAPVQEWWPFRNQLLITLAATFLVEHNLEELLIGIVKSDGAHQDGTPAFIDQLSSLLALQEGNLRVRAPAIHLSSLELIRQSGISWDILAWAHSCHVSTVACGQCRGCYKHIEIMDACGQLPH